FTLANPSIERVGDKLQLSVDFQATDPKDNDNVGVMLVFPSTPASAELVKTATAEELRATPKGRWIASVPANAAGKDATCDVVVKGGGDVGQLKQGKDVFRIGNVALPPAVATPPSVQIANVVVRQNAANSRMIDFSFDCTFSGSRPASDKLWFDAVFADTVIG